MTSLITISVLGFVLGVRHATDPDHVIAVSTIVSRERSMRGAALIGAAWGIGHTLTVSAVGLAVVLLGWVIPPRLGLSFEFGVGMMLIALGLANIPAIVSRFRRASPGAHAHAHAHGDYVHTHVHQHQPERHGHDPARTPLARLDAKLGRHAPYQLVRPLVVGLVHGLAGSAAVALLVIAAIPAPGWAAVYLAVFGVGTVVGMMAITVAIAVPFRVSAPRMGPAGERLRTAAGLISVAFGLFIAYRVGIVEGLLTGR